MRVFTLPAENWNELSIDKQVIRHLILKHRSLVDHLITLEDYYEGKHKILNDKNRENKLVCNHAKDISDTASSYFIGNPVTYKAQTDITDLTDKLEYAGADEADGDNGLDLSIFGRAYEYIYTKKDETDLMIKNLSPANTFVVYDDTIEQNELFAVYYYAKRDDSDRTDTKYIATVVTEHYKYILNIQNVDGIQPTYEQAEPHYKGEVPIIEYLNNKMGLGDFELQIPLIDAYNALMSDRVTDKEQFIDAILVDGTMITKILNSIGINADWINTGAFTVLDSDGNIMFKADTATGRVDIVANSFQLRGKTLEEIAKESTKNYVDAVIGDKIKDINTQYFDSYDPTLTNKPASDWTDADAKEKHIDDIFYNTNTKKMFRFVKIDGVYSWENFDDPDIKAALDAASTAQDTADGKRRVFLVTPTLPYDEGDMWVTSTTDGKGEIKICKTPRQSGAFSSADWISPSYVDSDDVNNAINEYDNSLGQPEIFNKLTNNGKNKGIYIQDGELYINASYILSGVLAGKFINGKGMSVTDKENKTTFYIDNDGNVMIAAKTLTIGGKDVEDIAGDTIDEKIKKAIPLVIQLSSEYQAIPVNADGNYSSFPRCEVKVQVFYGESDVTSEAAISYSTENITGTWSSGTHTYSVKSLSEDIGWVDFSTTYNGITITKRFNLAKQYAGGNGTNGKDATVYYLECETTTIKRCSNSSGGYDYSPSPLVFHLYSQTGAEERKQNISGRWTFEYTEDGSTWNAISGTGVGIDMKFSAWDRITNRTTAIRCTVGNSSGVILGMLSVSVLADAEVTREAVFNALTDNGDRQLIAYGSDGKLYINGEYIKSKTITADLIDVNTLDAIVAKIGGFVVGSSSIHTSGRNSMTSTTQGVYIGINGFSVYKDTSNYFNMNTSVGLQIKGGTIKLGNVTLAEASDKKSLSVKYGMQVHTQRSSGQFTDGSGEFKLINLTTVSSGQTLCIASNIVYKLSSSSKRYKNHVRNMDSSEADKLLKVPVVWFQYKKGYLKEGDSFEDKPVPGFYAEDVYKQYPEGVIFNEDGQIEDWNYRTMIPAMMKVIQDQNERINTLEDTVNTLNERLNKLEGMLKGVVK